jgi:site-specific recombinase XerC
LDDVLGRLLLTLAAILERGIASKTAVKDWKLRRNEVLRAAHRRGVPVEVLASRLGLTQSWVRYVIKNPKKAALEEAA